MDPLAEVSRRYSPYVYGLNNPIRVIDPDGMFGMDAIEGKAFDERIAAKQEMEALDQQAFEDGQTERMQKRAERIGKINESRDANSGFERNFKQFLAIVSGEAKNFEDAMGIGSVLLNRMEIKNTSFDDDDWLEKITIRHEGNKLEKDIFLQYNAYNGKIYNQVMKMNKDELAKSGYAQRVQGAISAYEGYMEDIDYSNGAYIWNATEPKTGFNWNMVRNGTYTITEKMGGTTFMRYTDQKKKWP